MDTTQPTSGATREFYLPGTFQFTRSPGRIERIVGRLFQDRDETELQTVETGGRDFYLPATPRVGPGLR